MLMDQTPPKAACTKETAVAQHVCANRGCLMRCKMTLVGSVLRLCHQAADEYLSAAQNRTDPKGGEKEVEYRLGTAVIHYSRGTTANRTKILLLIVKMANYNGFCA